MTEREGYPRMTAEQRAGEDLRTIRLALDHAASHLALLAEDRDYWFPLTAPGIESEVPALLAEAGAHIAEAKRVLLEAVSARAAYHSESGARFEAQMREAGERLAARACREGGQTSADPGGESG